MGNSLDELKAMSEVAFAGAVTQTKPGTEAQNLLQIGVSHDPTDPGSYERALAAIHPVAQAAAKALRLDGYEASSVN